MIGAAMTAAMLIPTAAFADACANLSRSAHSPGEADEVKGNWEYFEEFGGVWGFHHPTGDVLLVDSAACTNENRTRSHGIQTFLCP